MPNVHSVTIILDQGLFSIGLVKKKIVGEYFFVGSSTKVALKKQKEGDSANHSTFFVVHLLLSASLKTKAERQIENRGLLGFFKL